MKNFFSFMLVSFILLFSTGCQSSFQDLEVSEKFNELRNNISLPEVKNPFKSDVFDASKENQIANEEFSEILELIMDGSFSIENDAVQGEIDRLIEYADIEISTAGKNESEIAYLRKHGEHSTMYKKKVAYLKAMIDWGERIIAYKRRTYESIREDVSDRVNKAKKEMPKFTPPTQDEIVNNNRATKSYSYRKENNVRSNVDTSKKKSNENGGSSRYETVYPMKDF